MVEFDIQALTTAFIGGLMISAATSINFILKGRITGMSSIFNGIIKFDEGVIWKSSVLSGLLFSACIAFYLFGFEEFQPNSYFFDSPKKFVMSNGYFTSLVSGFLVGFGTKLGNGCTSGHGVCGLPRFSKRSIVAVLTFMATGMITANLRGYFLKPTDVIEMKYDPAMYVKVFFMGSISILIVNFVSIKSDNNSDISDILVSFVVGVLFGCGLLFSGMTRRIKVLSFLTLDSNWDPSLMAVVGGAVLGNIITFNFALKVLKKPLLAKSFALPAYTAVDWKLVAGAAIFGIGWGLNGICPGPAMVVAPVYFPLVVMFFFPGFITGQMMGDINNTNKIKQN